MKSLLIRADASSRIGTGHVMRCLALAAEWQSRGGSVTFLSRCESAKLRQRIEASGVEYIPLNEPHPSHADMETTLRLLEGGSRRWVVLDGYHLDTAYQRAIRGSGHRLLVVDDIAHLPEYHADIVLNQNITAPDLDYNCNPDALTLLGAKYALLRPEFAVWRGWEREIPEQARNILVTLGGGDPDNVTLKAVQALREVGDGCLNALVLVGYSNPNLELIESAAHCAKTGIRVVTAATDMPRLMAWADMAISAAGSTSWELCFMGLPSLMLVVADNQREIAAKLHESQAAVNLGWAADASIEHIAGAVKQMRDDSALRDMLSQNARRLVDGMGAERVVSLMTAMDGEVNPHQLSLREANDKDAFQLWRLANDSTVRANALSPEPIPYRRHLEWYSRKLSLRDTRIWVLELANTLVAQARYDRISADVAEIDYAVAPGFRGRGLGAEALKRSGELAFDALGVERLRGVVVEDNTASVRVFEKLGYERVGDKTMKGHRVYIFERGR